MEEVTRKCDMPKGTKGNTCGQRVPGDEPMQFNVGGVEYHADLCEQHRAAFSQALVPFIAIARPVSTRNGPAIRKALRGRQGVFTTADVRKWLREEGREVSPTGRLPQEVIAEYEAAHSS